MNRIIRYFIGGIFGFILMSAILASLSLFFNYELTYDWTFEVNTLLIFSTAIGMSYVFGRKNNNKIVKITLLFLGMFFLFLIGAIAFLFYIIPEGGFGS